MPERAASDAALRFVHDLQSLREARGVALTALHDATRVPLDVLEAFERNALYGNRLFNRVYLRSLVRGYADVIGFDPDRAVVALEEALAGQYDGSLLREPAESHQELDTSDDASFEDESSVVASAPWADEEDRQPVVPAPIQAPAESSLAPARPATPSPAVAWDAVSGSTRRPRVPTRETPWGMILGGLAVVALLLVVGIWWFNRSPETTPTETVSKQPQDTVQQQAPPPAPVTLPDTLTLRVTATNGPVSDIKITQDEDVRRPYWLEVGNSRDFSFLNRIVIEQELADATIQVQGRPYPTARQDSAGRLVITRDTVLRLLQQR